MTAFLGFEARVTLTPRMSPTRCHRGSGYLGGHARDPAAWSQRSAILRCAAGAWLLVSEKPWGLVPGERCAIAFVSWDVQGNGEGEGQCGQYCPHLNFKSADKYWVVQDAENKNKSCNGEPGGPNARTLAFNNIDEKKALETGWITSCE